MKLLLQKDADVRPGMLRDIDRAEDALADAHQRAEDTGRRTTVRVQARGANGCGSSGDA